MRAGQRRQGRHGAAVAVPRRGTGLLTSGCSSLLRFSLIGLLCDVSQASSATTDLGLTAGTQRSGSSCAHRCSGPLVVIPLTVHQGSPEILWRECKYLDSCRTVRHHAIAPLNTLVADVAVVCPRHVTYVNNIFPFAAQPLTLTLALAVALHRACIPSTKGWSSSTALRHPVSVELHAQHVVDTTVRPMQG
jgi:hypothetical protein